MKFQEEVIESAAIFTQKAAEIATAVARRARAKAARVAQDVDLNQKLVEIRATGVTLGKIAREHGTRFVRQNAAIASSARKDLGELARSAFANFARTEKPAPRARKSATRKRPARKAA